MKANQAFNNNDEAVSPVIGVILMVAITVVLAAVVFVLVTRLAGNQEDQSPTVTFSKDSNPSATGGTLTVVSVQGAPEAGLLWSDIDIIVPTGGSCTVGDTSTSAGSAGRVDSGEQITCTGSDGPYRLNYRQTNTLLYTATF